MRAKSSLKAHEVNTFYVPRGNNRKIMVKYLVIASSTPKAVSLIPLREGEEVLRAEELHHIVIVENENETDLRVLGAH